MAETGARGRVHYFDGSTFTLPCAGVDYVLYGSFVTTDRSEQVTCSECKAAGKRQRWDSGSAMATCKAILRRWTTGTDEA